METGFGPFDGVRWCHIALNVTKGFEGDMGPEGGPTRNVSNVSSGRRSCLFRFIPECVSQM